MKKLVFITIACILLTTGPLGADTTAPKVKLETTQGDIVLALNPDLAPKTVANFLQYTKDGFYDGTIFHRVIKGFMIQGGGLTEDMTKKQTHAPVENEAACGLKNTRGTIAMARTGAPHSATSQFFINTVDNPALDYRGEDPGTGRPVQWGYCVFGKVESGMDVVDKIAATLTTYRGGRSDVPVLPVVIKNAGIVSQNKATQP